MTKKLLTMLLLCSTILLFCQCEGKEEPSEPEPTETAEIMPSFQGGDINTFRQWVNGQLIYPVEASSQGIHGLVKVQFVIPITGKLRSIEVIESPSEILSNEVIRVLKLSPDWTPAKQKGKLVAVKFTLPINFVLS